MHQIFRVIDRPIHADTAKEAGGKPLGDLPDWDLTDLYTAPDAAELTRDLERRSPGAKIVGGDAGFEELVARLNALFRRQQGSRATDIEAGDLTLDPLSRSATLAGAPLPLSRQEFRLLHLFLRRAGQVLSQADLIDDLYALDDERERNTVEVLIGRLRRKIGRERITTLRGMGYRFEK